jgi:hypothetical protein
VLKCNCDVFKSDFFVFGRKARSEGVKCRGLLDAMSKKSTSVIICTDGA